MDDKLLREEIQKEIRSILSEANIDPYMSISDIAVTMNDIKRELEEVMTVSMYPDEAARDEIKQAYGYLKKSFEAINKLIPRYQHMAMRDD